MSGGKRPSAQSHPLDLNAIPSIALTPHMVAHLLRGLNEGATLGDPAPSSIGSASLQQRQMTTTTTREGKDDEHEDCDMEDQAEGSVEEEAPSVYSRVDIVTPPLTASTSTSPSLSATNIYPAETKQSNEQETDAADLDQQTEPAHGASRRSCVFCGRTFKRASDTRRHERIHTGTKPHVCEICGSGFVQKSALTTHMRTHTGERPYSCRVTGCDRAFGDASSRKKHERTHESVTANRYACPVCPSQVFRRSDTLSVHVRRMHPELLPANKAANNLTWKQAQAEPATAWKAKSARSFAGTMGSSSNDSPSPDSVQNETLSESCPASEVQSVFLMSLPPSAASSYTTFASASTGYGTGGNASNVTGPTGLHQLHYNKHSPFEPIVKVEDPVVGRGDKSRSLAPLPSSEDMFAFLNTEMTPKSLPGPFLNNRSGGLPARQPLARVPSFGSPYVSTPPPAKSNSQLFRELSDLFK